VQPATAEDQEIYKNISAGYWGATQPKFDVLDHGYVRLVECMGGDLSVVRAARVSYDAQWRTGEDAGKDTKLINYLLKNGHTSPFEMVEFTFEVKAPIFVFRQWHRHRTWSFNEVSARYSELPEEFYVPEDGQIGAQAKGNKQMREMLDAKAEVAGFKVEERDSLARNLMRSANENAFRCYRALITAGVPRELARSVLPVATYSHMFAKVDMHNLFHFLKLRLHEHAQYEIRVYAEAILKLIELVAPVSVAAFREHILKEPPCPDLPQ